MTWTFFLVVFDESEDIAKQMCMVIGIILQTQLFKFKPTMRKHVIWTFLVIKFDESEGKRKPNDFGRTHWNPIAKSKLSIATNGDDYSHRNVWKFF